MIYEVIVEIENNCKRNQLRDVSFEEYEISNPDEWVAGHEPFADRIEKSDSGGQLLYRVISQDSIKNYILTPED